ncbi:hypothetical protein D3C80_2204210 [compost metagenome]
MVNAWVRLDCQRSAVVVSSAPWSDHILSCVLANVSDMYFMVDRKTPFPMPVVRVTVSIRAL